MLQMLLVRTTAEERDVLGNICYVYMHLPMTFDPYFRFYQVCLYNAINCFISIQMKKSYFLKVVFLRGCEPIPYAELPTVDS